MKIEYFERNKRDEVVAVGDEKIELPWDFIAEFKPQVGDEVFLIDGKLEFGKKEPLIAPLLHGLPEGSVLLGSVGFN